MSEERTSAPVDAWVTSATQVNPRRAELHRLAEAGRSLIERMTTTDADPAAIERATAALVAAAAELGDGTKVRSYSGFAEAANAGGMDAHYDHSPMMGRANPIAPVVDAEHVDESTIEMRVTFGSAYEGPPSSVHGGTVAAMFDELLGMTQSLSGQPGMTARLTIAYRAPTPLHQPLRFVGTIDRVEGRKIFTTGRCYAGDTVTAEAEGLFISVDFARLAALMAERNAGDPPSQRGVSPTY